MTTARVLVVEDERIIALTLRRMLEDRGYTVVGTAASARAAVQKAKSASPDIVLMDIHLEGPTDGIDAARMIASEGNTPIVFLTAYTEDETIQRASQTPAYSYLVKPVQAAELHATIQIAIAKHALDRRLHLALDAASLAVWDWNTTADSVETNGDVTRVLGVDQPNTANLKEFFRDIVPEDRPAFDAFLARAAHHSKPADLVFRYQTRDSSISWLESYASTYRNAHSGSAHTIGTLRDITLQRESEARLRQAAALFEHLTDAVAIADETGRITAVNPAFVRLTGVDAAAANGCPIEQFVVIPNTDRSHWQGESQCLRPDGLHLAVWLTITPVSNGDPNHVAAIIFSFSDLSPLRRAQADLDFLAHHDSLTGLPNRRLFQEHVDALTALTSPFTLYYIDLDHFKLINDSRGHNVGDLVLQAIAARIRALAGESGFAARLGGDEFIIIPAAPVSEFPQTLVSTISEPIPIGAESLVTTASVGSSDFPANGLNRESLLLAADTAMYAAKRDGPNCYRRYTAELSVPHTERYEIEQSIRRSFASSELQLLYQPTISLLDGGITGAEALVRWRHPERGLLNPDRFVPIVEDAGLIDQLGEAVLRMACRDWAAWRDAGLTIPVLSINVSPRQMTRGSFPSLLYEILGEHNIPPVNVQIEITESSLQTIKRSQRFIRDCKAIGVQVAIDDFGTGYSHLAALRDLPVDRIKLDRAFLPSSKPRPSDIALLNAIVAIARAMNLRTTAEGVETVSQLELVRQIGCDEAQGFWFSHPMPFQNLRALFSQRPFRFKN